MMQPFRRHTAIAAPMLQDNIDTDSIIPVSQTKTASRKLGASLFFNRRYLPDGTENPGFVLNQPGYREASIIVAQHNFGCGSSREQAVWALADFGIRCVIAESFGDIFASNCLRMGVLLIALPRAAVAQLGAAVTAAQGLVPMTVDLQACAITGPDGCAFPFSIDEGARRILLEGRDAIGSTLTRQGDIADFMARDAAGRPWIHLPHPIHTGNP